jgi:hypothetical protein
MAVASDAQNLPTDSFLIVPCGWRREGPWTGGKGDEDEERKGDDESGEPIHRMTRSEREEEEYV